jgi:thiol:disulfide interchange protein
MAPFLPGGGYNLAMMGYLRLSAFAALAVLAFALIAGCNGDNAKEAVPWQTDLAAAQAQAKRLHQQVLIDFSASWCGPCRQMARDTWSNPAVAVAMKSMVTVKIDIDQQTAVAAQYGVNAIPAIRVLDAEGKVVRSTEGYMPPEQFLAWLSAKPAAVPGQ